MFVIQAVTSVMIDDLTRPEVQDASTEDDSEMDVDEGVPLITVEGGEEEPKLTKKEVDRAVRDSTAGFPDWVSTFFRQVLVVFEALPEPGKNSRSGGKMEDQMTQTLVVSRFFLSRASAWDCAYVCSICRPHVTSFVPNSLLPYSTWHSTSSIAKSRLRSAPTPLASSPNSHHASPEPTQARRSRSSSGFARSIFVQNLNRERLLRGQLRLILLLSQI